MNVRMQVHGECRSDRNAHMAKYELSNGPMRWSSQLALTAAKCQGSPDRQTSSPLAGAVPQRTGTPSPHTNHTQHLHLCIMDRQTDKQWRVLSATLNIWCMRWKPIQKLPYPLSHVKSSNCYVYTQIVRCRHVYTVTHHRREKSTVPINKLGSNAPWFRRWCQDCMTDTSLCT